MARVAKVIDGLPLNEPREVELFEQCTGRTYSRKRAAGAADDLVGWKTRRQRPVLSAVAVWRAALVADWRKHISAGEQAVVMLLGADRKQAAILRRYCEGLLQRRGCSVRSCVRTATSSSFAMGRRSRSAPMMRA